MVCSETLPLVSTNNICIDLRHFKAVRTYWLIFDVLFGHAEHIF